MARLRRIRNSLMKGIYSRTGRASLAAELAKRAMFKSGLNSLTFPSGPRYALVDGL